jgi:hypothetical protein
VVDVHVGVVVVLDEKTFLGGTKLRKNDFSFLFLHCESAFLAGKVIIDSFFCLYFLRLV